MALLFCLVFFFGTSLASNVSSWDVKVPELEEVLSGITSNPEVVSMVETALKHQEYLEVCQESAGQDLRNIESCVSLAKDTVETQILVANLTKEAAILYSDGVKLSVKFNGCLLESILNRIECYEQCWLTANSLVATAEVQFLWFQSTMDALVLKIQTDYQSCFSAGFTSVRFDAAMTQCKLKYNL